MKKRVKLKVVLSLLIMIAVIVGTLPISAIAEGSASATKTAEEAFIETSAETEAEAEIIETEGSTAGETSAATDEVPSVETEEPAKSEASAAPSAEPETEPSPSLTNSIGGMVWSDANADGVKDEDEIGIAGYAVELYRGGEKIDSVVTQEDGAYRFADLTSGEYKVGVQARTLDGTEYLIPIKSIQTGEDNKFDADFTSEEEIAFTGAITMAEDTLTEHMDAGMRSNVEIMPMNATGAYVVTGDTTGTNYGTFNNIQTALNVCPRYGYASNPEPCTITVMANDPDTGAGTTGGSANASGEIRNQRITITSGPGGPYTLTRAVGSSPESKENRHFIVAGTSANKSSLTLSNITLSGHGLTSGRKSSGGIQVVDYSSLIINAGTTITKCYQYAGNGMGVYISPGQNSMTMTGGTISNNYTGTSGSAIGNGGGVLLADFVTGGITITGGSITNNSVGNDGGGVYVGKNTPFKMTGGSITGNTAGNDGGGIFSANSGYRDPADVNSYANLSITGSAVVSGNTSGMTEVPPANASIYTTRATNPFPGTLLNNDNISYRNYCYVTYKANNGTSEPDYVQLTTIRKTIAGNLLTVTQSNAGFSSQPPKTVFAGWNTRADGTGTSYKAGQSIMISDNLTLYAQWKAERYQVYKDSAPTTIVGTYRLMADAVAACGTTSGASGSSYTIVATEDDPDMNNVAGSAGNWVNIPNGKSITVKSDEGGPYVLTQTRVVSSGSGSPWHFGIASGGELTLEDITLSGTGVTSGNQTNGGVRGLAGGKLTINAGTTITKCYAGSSTGGGVDISGSFIMNGGVISNNKSAGGASGGVRCGSSFTMNGGSITGNEGVSSVGASGGGVFVSGSSALFTMNGGSITGNTSSIGQGGGVYLYMGGRMTMTGGSITGNTAKEGGGIYSEDYDYHNPANVSKYSNIAISGSAVVSGNTSGRTYAPPSNAAAFTTRATDPFPGTLLDNDNINYGIGYAVTYKANNGTTVPDYVQSTNVIAGSSVITTVTATTAGFGISAPGFTFLGWNTRADGTGTAYTAGQVVSISGNMTLYAQWNHERYIVYKDSAPTTPVGSYHWLRDAVNACGASSTGAYTIVATENDTDITNVTGLGMVGAARSITLGSKNITLKSDSGGPYTLTMQYESLGSAMQYGHFVVDVNGSLTVENVTLSGKALTSGNNGNGGVYLNSSSGRFTMNAGATITKCYKSNTGPAGGVTVEGGAIFTMNGGSITGNIGRIGGGVNVYNATFIMTGGSVANNTSIYGGGGVGIFDGTGQFTMTGGSITNNTAAVDGGGIYTGDYDYNDPVNTNKYMRISITGGTVSGNTSAGTFTAPSNASAFTTRATNPFPGTLLDNDNINFHFNPTVTYDANNASGGTYTDAGTPQYVVGDTVTVKAWAATGLAADTGWEIDYWCTTNDGTGTHYAPADTFTITSNKTLYAMYKRTTHDMTLSNMVSGSYADRTKDFGFTVYLANESGTPLTGTFAYTGGTISGSGANAPAGGTIMLGSSGEAVLRLKHGQTVNIKDVPFGYKVRIVQTAATGYTASFRDNEDAGPTAAVDTGVRTMSAANRRFDFTSTRSGVVPTGVSESNNASTLMVLGAVVLIALGVGFIVVRRNRRRREAR